MQHPTRNVLDIRELFQNERSFLSECMQFSLIANCRQISCTSCSR